MTIYREIEQARENLQKHIRKRVPDISALPNGNKSSIEGYQ